MSTVVAGIDVGTRNLAVCVMSGDGGVILHWKLSDILEGCKKKPKTEYLCKMIVAELDAILWEDLGVSSVLIENQYIGQFTNISNWIYCYFVIRSIPVKFCDAKLKFNNIFASSFCSDGKYNIKNYKHRKDLAIITTKAFLDTTSEINSKYLLFFNNMKKKDDVSDALLYCLIQFPQYKCINK